MVEILVSNNDIKMRDNFKEFRAMNEYSDMINEGWDKMDALHEASKKYDVPKHKILELYKAEFGLNCEDEEEY